MIKMIIDGSKFAIPKDFDCWKENPTGTLENYVEDYLIEHNFESYEIDTSKVDIDISTDFGFEIFIKGKIYVYINE